MIATFLDLRLGSEELNVMSKRRFGDARYKTALWN
jgi:hypothetical protein